MRWLKLQTRSERGATAVMVAIVMVPVIACLGIALDVGALYAERAQLQNGADAAALAIGQDCAEDDACPADPTAMAGEYASKNANDSAANALISAFGTTATGSRTVAVESRTRVAATGAAVMEHPFAAIVGATASSVHAHATVEWGAPIESAVLLPIAISYCEFRPALDGTVQLIRYDQELTCASRDGHPIPGGFGWLERAAGCTALVDTTDLTVPSEPGNSYPNSSACDSLLMTLAGKTILVPIFDGALNNAGVNDTSGPADRYHIYGFAAFKILGWKFSGSSTLPKTSLVPGGPSCTGNCRGIIGSFVNWVPPDDALSDLGGPNLGAYNVRLTQ